MVSSSRYRPRPHLFLTLPAAAISPHGLRNFGKLRSNSRLRPLWTAAEGGGSEKDSWILRKDPRDDGWSSRLVANRRLGEAAITSLATESSDSANVSEFERQVSCNSVWGYFAKGHASRTYPSICLNKIYRVFHVGEGLNARRRKILKLAVLLCATRAPRSIARHVQEKKGRRRKSPQKGREKTLFRARARDAGLDRFSSYSPRR